MTSERRDAFLQWAEDEAEGAVHLEGEYKKESNHRIRAGFDVMRKVFPEEEDWLGEVWERLTH